MIIFHLILDIYIPWNYTLYIYNKLHYIHNVSSLLKIGWTFFFVSRYFIRFCKVYQFFFLGYFGIYWFCITLILILSTWYFWPTNCDRKNVFFWSEFSETHAFSFYIYFFIVQFFLVSLIETLKYFQKKICLNSSEYMLEKMDCFCSTLGA